MMGGVLCIAGILLENTGVITGVIGISICLYGIARAYDGYRRHHVIENQND